MILTKPQAEAVFSAMCALKNVGMTCNPMELVEAGTSRVYIVYETPTNGRVLITLRDVKDPLGHGHEVYEDKSSFAAAYGLDHTPQYHTFVDKDGFASII